MMLHYFGRFLNSALKSERREEVEGQIGLDMCRVRTVSKPAELHEVSRYDLPVFLLIGSIRQSSPIGGWNFAGVERYA